MTAGSADQQAAANHQAAVADQAAARHPAAAGQWAAGPAATVGQWAAGQRAAGQAATAGQWASGQRAAADRGRLRASHADRERVIEVLKTAFVQGRLTKDELEARAGQTFAARTYADLAALTADLPAGLTAARAPCQSDQPPVTKAVLACAGAAIAPAMLLVAFATNSETMFKLFFLVAVLYIAAWLVAGAQMLDTWYQNARRQPPPSDGRGTSTAWQAS